MFYTLNRSKSDPQVYKVLESYTDEDALKAHGQTEYFKAPTLSWAHCSRAVLTSSISTGLISPAGPKNRAPLLERLFGELLRFPLHRHLHTTLHRGVGVKQEFLQR